MASSCESRDFRGSLSQVERLKLESAEAARALTFPPLALGLSLGLRRYKIRYVNYPDRRILPSSEIWFSTTSLSVLATISMHLAIILSIFSPLWKRSLCALLSYAHSSCIYYSHIPSRRRRIGQRTTSYASEKYPRHRTFKWK